MSNAKNEIVTLENPKIQTSGSEISQSADNRNHGVRNYQFVLPWAHYLILTHVSDPDARSFYEIEAFKQQWSKLPDKALLQQKLREWIDELKEQKGLEAGIR